MSAADFDTIVVGGGHGGAQVGAALRAKGYEGSIAILEASAHPPYDRPPLTKAFLRGEREESDLLLRGPEFWADSEISLLTSSRVAEIRPAERSVVTDAGAELRYGKLVWATGGTARRFELTQALAGVHTIRTIDDAKALRTELDEASSVVVLGGGYIGLETASVLRELGIEVTVLEAQDRLLARVTSPPVSRYFLELHRERGVEVVLAAAVERVERASGAVAGVELAGGRRIAADVIVVGTGMLPTIAPLERAGVTCSNGVETDADGRTSATGIYALGDCANRPNPYAGGLRLRLESVQNALDQANVVADAITGTAGGRQPVPWFWSHQYDVKLRTVGLSIGYDEAIVRGDPEGGAFSVVYLKEGSVIALDSINTTRDYAQAKALVRERAAADRERLADPEIPLR